MKNKKSKTIFKIMGITFIIIILVISVSLILNYKKLQESKNQTNEFIEKYNKIASEEVSYVIVEINPKAVLEVVNDKIINMGCLNSDCQNIFNVDITNKTLNQAIEILYNTSIEKGIDVSNGVTVSSANNEVESYLSNLEYVKYNPISNNDVNKYLKEVIDNNDISNSVAKNSYINKLFEFYKNDSDYGNVYTCNITNDELSCYITEQFMNNLPYDITLTNIFSYNELHQKLMNTFDKFNIKYESKLEDVEGFDLFKINNIKEIKISEEYFSIGASYYEDNNIYNCYNIILSSTLESGEYGYSYKTLPLSKLNLVNLEYNENDLVTLRNYQSVVISSPVIQE